MNADAPESIRREISQSWDELLRFWSMSLEEIPDAGELLEQSAAECAAKACESLEPWMSILGLGAIWLGALHASLLARLRKGEVPDEFHAPTAFIGAAAAYANAVRRLCRVGLDAPARAVLRSLTEMLDVATATLWDTELRRAIRGVTFEQSTEFWSKHLRPKQLARVLTRVEAAILGDAHPLLLEMRRGRMARARWLSMFTHPNCAAAMLASSPSQAAELGATGPGTIGVCSDFSIVTLDVANEVVCYFAFIGARMIFEQPKLFEADRENMLEVTALVGRDVFCGIAYLHRDDHKSAIGWNKPGYWE